MKLALAICDANIELFGIHALNYPQNDLRFVIVSTDNLEFGPIHRIKQTGNSVFLQGWLMHDSPELDQPMSSSISQSAM